MYMLKLYDRDNATHPLEVRLLESGTIAIGRDPAADWPIADPDCALSRAHCEIHAATDGLSITVRGANGVFDALTGARLPSGEQVRLALPGTLTMGRYRMVAMLTPHAGSTCDPTSTMVLAPPLGTSIDVPSEWHDAPDLVPAHEASLLEAFCQGAGLDPSVLSAEEPDVIMQRAGALYRQMILGIGDLMAERDIARASFHMNRTTITGEGNNPFKWAPSQRLAIDLLLAESSGFLSGPAALKASFKDLKRHLVATFAGLQGSLRAAVSMFDPVSIENAASNRAGILKSRLAAQAEEVSARYADLSEQLADGRPGSLDQAFAAAYLQAEASLNETQVR